MPTFLSTKRSRVIGAAGGTLTLATAISAAAVAFSAGSAAASGASDAFMAMPAVHTSVTQQGDTMSQAQSLASFDQVRFAQGAKQQAYDVAVAKAAAAKAAAAKAAAERHAAALKAAAAAAAARANQQAAQPAQTTATQSTATPSGSPEQIAQQMLGQFGWSASQFSCLQPLWYHESGWNVTAENPGSGAYGIPQALPGSQMASAGPDWQTNAATQIKWGLTYIQSRYGSPCGAWAHEQADNWY
jgi:hypothetical protein